MDVTIKETKKFNALDILELYNLNNWSSGKVPDLLINGLKNSHCLILAYCNNKIIGLGNAISDGYLVVYFPHLLVHPDYQGKGVGKLILNRLKEKYAGFHQQMLTADKNAIDFYTKNGFNKAGETQSMWIYEGNDH